MFPAVRFSLLTSTVPSTPSMSPTMGFCSSSDCENTLPVFLPERSLNDVDKKSREQMNRYRHARAATIFRIACGRK